MHYNTVSYQDKSAEVIDQLNNAIFLFFMLNEKKIANLLESMLVLIEENATSRSEDFSFYKFKHIINERDQLEIKLQESLAACKVNKLPEETMKLVRDVKSYFFKIDTFLISART